MPEDGCGERVPVSRRGRPCETCRKHKALTFPMIFSSRPCTKSGLGTRLANALQFLYTLLEFRKVVCSRVLGILMLGEKAAKPEVADIGIAGERWPTRNFPVDKDFCSTP